MTVKFNIYLKMDKVVKKPLQTKMLEETSLQNEEQKMVEQKHEKLNPK